jgi:hypothetical protein
LSAISSFNLKIKATFQKNKSQEIIMWSYLSNNFEPSALVHFLSDLHTNCDYRLAKKNSLCFYFLPAQREHYNCMVRQSNKQVAWKEKLIFCERDSVSILCFLITITSFAPPKSTQLSMEIWLIQDSLQSIDINKSYKKY